MRSLLPILGLALLLSGCEDGSLAALSQNRSTGADYDDSAMPPLAPGDDDEEDPTSSDDDDTAEPDPSYALDILDIEPPPESDDHHYRDPIVVTFNGYAAGVQLRVVNEDGTSLATYDRWNADFTELTVQPYELSDGSGFLRPLHTYTVGVDIGNSSLSWSFSTSVVGTPVEDPDSLQGRTYAVSFADARSPEHPGLAELLAAVQGPTWLWQIDLSAGNIDFNYGLGEEDDLDADGFNQDLCTPTGLVGGSDAAVDLDSNPYFSSQPGEFVLWLDGQALRFEEGWIDGDFLADGSALVEVGYRGWLRADSLSPLLGDDTCALLASQADLSCGPCPSGEGECAWVDVRGVSGVETGAELAAVADDADCSDGDALRVVSCSAVGGRAGGWLLLPLLLGLRLRRR